jgi:hypothetical protein
MNEQTLKEYIKSLVREILEEENGSTSGDAGAYSTPYAFSRKGQKSNAATQAAEDEGFTKVKPGMPSDSKILDYKQLMGKSKKYKIYESIDEIVKAELINEVTYNKFKSEVKLRTKNEQLHKAIKEVKRKLMEIDRIVEYTSMMKQELSEDGEGLRYWKTTENNISTIAEMVDNLNNKIKNLQ